MRLTRLMNDSTAAIRRRLGHRARFAGPGDWAISLYDSLLRYAKRWPLPMRGRASALRLSGLSRPIHLRLGSSDGFVMEEIFIANVYDCVTSADLGEVSQIVDLGANVGLSVRLWRERYPAARIVAVEPDAGNLEACRRNVGDDGAATVRLVAACVAAKNGWVSLDRSAEECAVKMIEAGANGPAVASMTLPDILQQCGMEGPVDLLKCDIEGAEQEVFADCADWIGRVRHLMIELHPPYGRANLLADLQRAGWPGDILWEGVTAGNELLFLRRAGS